MGFASASHVIDYLVLGLLVCAPPPTSETVPPTSALIASWVHVLGRVWRLRYHAIGVHKRGRGSEEQAGSFGASQGEGGGNQSRHKT